jgi:N-acetylglucosaminyl-diphospho-decaprenol L-rhamnosyltransferase
MKDLRIIIVSWNVEQCLERCLHSLKAACGYLDWDCVVVDNASSDGSAALAKRIAKSDQRVSVIANPDNRGFAKACNQGMAGFDARYVVLLNPDTECPINSLDHLFRAADREPRAGIIGPKLTNTDGSTQASIRRFPTVWSQAGIMLKMHNIFPGLKMFRKYFAQDISLEKEQDVDQVMGACFLIRRELIEQIGGLDERFFLWFEEVDYCKRAIQHGWSVRYIPAVSVIHHGGQSFDQALTLTKQRYLNHSIVAYFRKWQPGWRSAWLWALQPKSLALAWMVGKLGLASWGSKRVLKGSGQQASRPAGQQNYGAWIAFILLLEAVSALTIFSPTWNSAALLLLGFVVAVLAWKRPTLALAILLLEVMIGGKGYLLQLGVWPDTISLRIVLFIMFLFGWAVNALQTGAWRSFKHLLKGRLEYVLLAFVVVYGVIRGVALHNGPVLADANAWGFLILLIPVLDLASRKPEQLKHDVIPVLILAPIWLACKTFVLEYIFSHGIQSIAPSAYLWVRRTGVGEVTLVVANAFRIFMQSYIYEMPALLFGVSWYLKSGGRAAGRPGGRVADWMLVSAIFALGVSLSRSMWIGCAAGLVVLAVLYRRQLLKSWNAMGRIVLLGVAAIAMIFVALAFPYPHVEYASLKSLFGSRLSTEDAAAASRWKLFAVVADKIKEHPILGSGFGATVTYESKDPRILSETPSGIFTTYAFEWGWLEHWVKFGIFGFALMIAVIWRLGQRILRCDAPQWAVYGAFASLIALAATHIFTPYLNHPLGFTMLFIGEAMTIVMTGKRHEAVL